MTVSASPSAHGSARAQTAPDQVEFEQVERFAVRVGEELSATLSAGLAVLGDRLGLYRALAADGPVTPAELAARTGCAERYVREWLANQAAGGWVHYDDASGRFTLPSAHVPVLADEDSPAFLLPSAQVASALFSGLDRLADAFRTGEGISWGAHDQDLHEGTSRFFRSATAPYLRGWVEELDGMVKRLEGGGRIVDVGCGRGGTSFALAAAFPDAEVLGIDAHEDSIEAARRAAAQAGLADRVRFEVSEAQRWTGHDVDLVCLLDCLHDMGDPVSAARQAMGALGAGGAVLIVEPYAGEGLAENLNWVSRGFYATSTAFCTPSALAQPGGWALGNQAGESRLHDVLAKAGLPRVRRVAATPFQLVLEARPQ